MHSLFWRSHPPPSYYHVYLSFNRSLDLGDGGAESSCHGRPDGSGEALGGCPEQTHVEEFGGIPEATVSLRGRRHQKKRGPFRGVLGAR